MALAVEAARLEDGRYQDTIADGDDADGREIEDEMDANDDIVDDYGFARNWGWNLRGTQGDLLQIDSELNIASEMRFEDGTPAE